MATPKSKRLSPENGGFLSLLRPYSRKLLLTVGLLAMLALTNMALPFTLKLLIDDVFPGESGGVGKWGLLWLILPGLLFIYLARNALFYSSRMISVHVSEDLCFRLRRRLYEHLQQLSLGFYKSNQPGKVASRLMDDTFKIQSFIQDKLPTLLLNVLMFQILVVILYTTNWRLALVSTLVLPLHLVTYYRFKRRMRSSQSESQENLASAYGGLIERFLGIEVVKGFSAEARESANFNRSIDNSRQSQIRTQRLHFMQKVIADLLIGLGTIFLLGFGAREVMLENMTGGTFFMFFGYVAMLYPAVVEIMSGTGHLSKTTACVDRTLEILMEPIMEYSNSDISPEKVDQLGGNISFEEVSFSYSEGNPVLRDLSFKIESGEHVSVVGPSGSGKSTMVNLIPRFLQADNGTIRMGAHDLEAISTVDLRRQISMVFQEVFLFNTSILENLRYAKPEAKLDEISEVAALTGVQELIKRLPNGYETVIGSSGVELSRGEKQRLTLARSLLKRPQVLILDEATASLDQESSHRITRAVCHYMQNRTVIMITHERDLIELTDRVLELEKGKLTYDGPADRYLAKTPTTPSERDKQMLPDIPTRLTSVSSLPMQALLLCLICTLFAGCTTREEVTSNSLDWEEPKANSGWVVSDHELPDLDQLAAALEESRPDGTRQDDPELREVTRPEPAPLEQTEALPEGSAGRLIPLPSMGKTEVQEMLQNLILVLTTEEDYQYVGSDVRALPEPPETVQNQRALKRQQHGATAYLQLGYIRSLTQPAQLWVRAITDQGDALLAGQQVDDVAVIAEGMVRDRDSLRTFIEWSDLEVQVASLSYVDSRGAMLALRRLGITTHSTEDEISTDVNFHELPVVVQMPALEAESVGLVGKQEVARDKLGLTLMPSVASKLPDETISSPTSQLLIFYHPSFPDQLTRVRNALERIVDVPARQIFVEGMVLEIGESALEELGIQWEMQRSDLLLGTLTPGNASNTLSAMLRQGSISDISRDLLVTLEALVREGKAEILSRPSILALDNRQATIRVGRDVPIATSGTVANNNKLSFSFHYIPTGILLNIRPRITEDGKEVSLLVDTTVSAALPDQDLEIRDDDGDLLAKAPTISIRRVQTYARIANNTPFIVGGLVSREMSEVVDKVPVLGDVPYLGALFRSRSQSETKREVIIVLTPYVIPDGTYVARSLPKDEGIFDSFGRKLFRDFYRIRAEDVFDLDFITQNQRLITYQSIVDQVIHNNHLLAEKAPFSHFTNNQVPGADVLVHRMTYDVIKSLEIDDRISEDQLLFLEHRDFGGVGVDFMPDLLKKHGDGQDPMSFFRLNPGKALAMTFSYDRKQTAPGNLIHEPVPVINVVNCPDRDAWRTLLWNLNQQGSDGRQMYTILIQSPGDLQRIRRAMVLKQMVSLNFAGGTPGLEDFNIGKVLMLPELKESQSYLIDADVARFFFATEHYYDILDQRLEQELRTLDAALRLPSMQPFLEDVTLPPPPASD